MPIKEVFLYDNGYAVFHREALLEGSGQIDLFFHRQHMKSVLDSLRFYGEASSKVGNIAYESTRPEANVNIKSEQPFLDLLLQMRGLDVKIVSQDGTSLVGRLLGVEQGLPEDCDDRRVMSPLAMLFVDRQTVRTAPLTKIQSVEVLDDRMKRDVSHALDLVTVSEKEDVQKLSIFFSDVPSAQTVQSQYGLVVAEWKSSYRLVFTNDAHSAFQLDGMAIVENNLDEDWTNVQLTLVVGAPPLHTAESTSTNTGLWELLLYDVDGTQFSVRCNPKDTIMSIKMKIREKRSTPPHTFKLIFAGKELDEGRLVSDYTISNRSTLRMQLKRGAEGGASLDSTKSVEFVMASQDGLSYYPIKTKVTAQRKQKAIVPLLQATLQAQSVLLYDELVRRGNPLSAILFENCTGRTLEGGSLQVYKAERFLGSSELPTLAPGDESPPIAYAVKRGCEVQKQTATRYLDWHTLSISDGSLSLIRKRHEITTYLIQNKTDEPLDFLLNHYFLDGYDLVREDLFDEIGEPVDITDRVYQFRFPVAAKDEKKKFVVVEECEDMQKTLVSQLTREVVERYGAKKWISREVLEELKASLQSRRDIDGFVEQIYAREEEMREVKDTQSRLRSNISALEGNKVEAAKYIKSLAAEEDKLKALQARIKQHRVEKQALQRQLEEQTRRISFSNKELIPPKEQHQVSAL